MRHATVEPTGRILIIRYLPLVGLILLLTPYLRAQTEVATEWISTDPGRYSVATNWSTGTVPNNDSMFTYDVAIYQGTAVADQDATINSLLIGVDGNLRDHGPGIPPTGTVITAGNMENDGSVFYTVNGKLNISGQFMNTGTFSLDATAAAEATFGDTTNCGLMSTSPFGGHITVNGTLTNKNVIRSGLLLDVNGHFINTDTGMVSTDFSAATNRINGDFDNSGMYSGGAHDVITGTVQNDGTMTLGPPHSSTRIGILNNDGLVQILNLVSANEINNSSTLRLKGVINVIDTGSFTQDSDGVWEEGFETTFQTFGTVKVNGSMSLDGTLDLTGLSNAHLVQGQSFDLATFPPGNLDGSFSTVLGNSFSNGTLMLEINYDQNAGRIRLTAVPTGSQGVRFTPTKH